VQMWIKLEKPENQEKINHTGQNYMATGAYHTED
jgi:hypothetical protein